MEETNVFAYCTNTVYTIVQKLSFYYDFKQFLKFLDIL